MASTWRVRSLSSRTMRASNSSIALRCPGMFKQRKHDELGGKNQTCFLVNLDFARIRRLTIRDRFFNVATAKSTKTEYFMAAKSTEKSTEKSADKAVVETKASATRARELD